MCFLWLVSLRFKPWILSTIFIAFSCPIYVLTSSFIVTHSECKSQTLAAKFNTTHKPTFKYMSDTGQWSAARRRCSTQLISNYKSRLLRVTNVMLFLSPRSRFELSAMQFVKVFKEEALLGATLHHVQMKSSYMSDSLSYPSRHGIFRDQSILLDLPSF